MEVYRHDIGAVQQVASVMVQSKGIALISAVLTQAGADDPLVAQAASPQLPVTVGSGYTRLTLAGHVFARYVELIGVSPRRTQP